MTRDDRDRSRAFLSGGGEAAARIAALDWSVTPLGPIEDWPQSRKTALSMMLRAPLPMVTLWGEEGVMIYNDAYAAFAGSRHPGVFGTRVREGWPEVAAFNDNVMKVGLAGGTLAYRDEPLVLNRNGGPERAWLNLDYYPILDEAGKPAAVMAIVVETTAKVRAERQLQDEQARLRQYFDQAPGIMATLEGPDHVFTLANAAYVDLVGGRDLVGKSIAEALPEIVGQGFIDLLDRVVASKEAYVGRGVQARLKRRPDAEPEDLFLDFVYQPIFNNAGEVEGVFVQGHDVTEQMQAEMAIRESENRFRLVAENAPVMLWMSDAAGHCIYLNAMQRAFWGVEPEGVATFDWTATIHEDDRDALESGNQEATGVHRPITLEVRHRRADGTFRRVLTNAQPRFGGDGSYQGMIGVNVDVTAIREYEESLQALNETLEQRVADAIAERSVAEEALRQSQKMEAMGKLTGGVAHDFNNLLQVISGNLQLLSRESVGNDRAEARIGNALVAVGQGAKLASQLLAFGRRQPLEPRVVNLGRLVTGMGELLRRTIGEGIEVETVVADDLWNSLVDPAQLESAVLNLAINARDAMGSFGHLTIEVGNASLDDGYALANSDVKPGQYVVVAVSDTGAGIAADILNRVFEPFFSTKPVGKGTGLGLSMVYGFVKQSGGHVKIDSEAGTGTTVRVYLPRIDRSEDVLAPVEAGPVAGGTETILVAEDDDEVRATVVALLRDLGYRVLLARDAASALRVVESGARIDLLFTDVVMPGPMRSTELARLARARSPGLAILFTSGYTEDSIVHDGRLDPGLELLSKPYTREALARKLRQVLAKAAESAPPTPRRVLLVEDDALIRMNAADILQEAGLVVVEGGTGRQALAALDAGPVDVCMIDIGLPDMSGVDLARRIRERLPTVPILFATGHAHVPEADTMTGVATLPKPYAERALLAAIDALSPGAVTLS